MSRPSRARLSVLATVTLSIAAATAIGVMLGRRRARRLAWELDRRLPLGPDGVIDGAGPIALEGRNGAAVLLVHGGGDTPQTLAYVARALNERGYTVHAPLLPGHGRGVREFSRVHAEDLIDSVRAEYAALRRRHRQVAVVGLSMGGALVARLAAERGDVPALVLIAPYLVMPKPAALAAWLSPLWEIALPVIRTAEERSIHDATERVRSRGYGAMTGAALRALARTSRAGWDALPRVTAPTLVIQSREDNRVTVQACESAFARLGAGDKRLEWIVGAGHVVTVDFSRERVARLTCDWIDEKRGVRDLEPSVQDL